MSKRLTVIAFENTKDMSKRDEELLLSLLNLWSKKLNFRWCRTFNPEWVRALADEMGESKDE